MGQETWSSKILSKDQVSNREIILFSMLPVILLLRILSLTSSSNFCLSGCTQGGSNASAYWISSGVCLLISRSIVRVATAQMAEFCGRVLGSIIDKHKCQAVCSITLSFHQQKFDQHTLQRFAKMLVACWRIYYVDDRELLYPRSSEISKVVVKLCSII